MVIAGFPNPVDWAVDEVKGFVGDASAGGFELALGGLTAWVLDAVVWVVGGVFNFFFDATDPNVQADWFVRGDGPYATTAALGATLLVGFVLLGIAEGVLAGDVAGMLRRMALNLPLAVLGMVGLVGVTQALVRLTDELSKGLLNQFQADIDRLNDVVAPLSLLSGGAATALVVFLLGLVSVLAGLVLLAELVVRSALVYIVVALAPLVFAVQLWPAMRGTGRRLLELLAALIVSKLVIAVALAVAAAAVVGAGDGGEVTTLPEPEVMTEDPGGSVTQAVGILLAAAAAFGVAAFSPLLVAKLLPVTEAALVAQGIKGSPVRAGQQALSTASYARMIGGQRLSRMAAGPASPAGGGAGGAAGSAAVAGGGGSGPAAGAAAGVAVTGAKATGRTAGAGARAASEVADGPHSPRRSDRRSGPPRHQPPNPRPGNSDERGRSDGR
jgi:type IV secretion system protein TrbL